MNKGKLLIAIACLILVHTMSAAATEIGTYLLNPLKKVSPTETGLKEIFAREFNILAFALGIYHLDVEKRFSKNAIKKHLIIGAGKCEKILSVVFDLDNIDFRRKGLTRYYPFKAGGNDYIIRVFHSGERHYLEDFEIFYEGVFEESSIGFQIIPGINEILKEKKAEKIAVPDSGRFAASL